MFKTLGEDFIIIWLIKTDDDSGDDGDNDGDDVDHYYH